MKAQQIPYNKDDIMKKTTNPDSDFLWSFSTSILDITGQQLQISIPEKRKHSSNITSANSDNTHM